MKFAGPDRSKLAESSTDRRTSASYDEPTSRFPTRSRKTPSPAVNRTTVDLTGYPDIGPVLPAMGYGEAQLAELGETIRAVPCDAVVIGSPIDLGRLVDLGHPSRRATYELHEVGSPTLATVLAPYLAKWTAAHHTPAR